MTRLEELAAFERGYVRTSNGQMHYATIGSGQPLLMIHQSAQSWKIYARLAAILASDYRVVAIDLPGFGESSPLPQPFEIADIVRVIVELLDGLGIDHAYVSGHHTGATVSCELAAAHPERMLAIAPSGFLYLTPTERERTLAEVAARREPRAPLFNLKADGSHLLRAFERLSLRRWQGKVSAAGFEGRPPNLILPFDQPQQRPEYTLDDEDIVLVNESIVDNLRAAPHGAQPTIRAVISYDSQSRLALIAAPTLFIESSGPFEEPFLQRANKAQGLIPGSRVARIENGDVFVTHSRAPEYAEVLRSFFDERG